MIDAVEESLEQADALLFAGWSFELPEIVNRIEDRHGSYRPMMGTEVWQWYWRAPPKRQGQKGRRYLSTNQAYRALMREKKT